MLNMSVSVAEIDVHDTTVARTLALAGHTQMALSAYQKILILQPDNMEAVHFTGVILADLRLVTEGLDWIRRSLTQGPMYSSLGLTNYAIALQRIERIQEAERVLDKALSIDSYFALALLNKGHVLRELGNRQQAAHYYQKVVTLTPNDQPAYEHVVYCLSYPESLFSIYKSSERSYFLSPTSPDAAYLYGLYSLLVGRFDQGWDLMDHRWETKHLKNDFRFTQRLSLPRPYFTTHHPIGPVFIWAEQGVGDEIMFLSLLTEFIDVYGIKIIVQVDKRMLPLWQASFKRVQFIPRGVVPTKESYQSHMTMGDFPKIFRRDRKDFVGKGTKFLNPDLSEIEKFSRLLRNKGKPVIGLGWYSSNGTARCLRLLELARVIIKFDVTIVNLQYGDHAEEISHCEKVIGRKLFHDTGIDCKEELTKLAALISTCDLVVSVANTTVHLAGSLGVKTYAILPLFPGWRWLDNGSECLWYRSVKLMRQSQAGEWKSVLTEIETELNHSFREDRSGAR